MPASCSSCLSAHNFIVAARVGLRVTSHEQKCHVAALCAFEVQIRVDYITPASFTLTYGKDYRPRRDLQTLLRRRSRNVGQCGGEWVWRVLGDAFGNGRVKWMSNVEDTRSSIAGVYQTVCSEGLGIYHKLTTMLDFKEKLTGFTKYCTIVHITCLWQMY